MSTPHPKDHLRVEIAPGADLTGDPLDWSWVDITGFIHRKDEITYSSGARDESESAPPPVVTLTLDNTDGRFSPRNPLGPWFGRLARNTPLRLWWDTDPVSEIVYVSEWPPRWDRTTVQATVPVSSDGITRRMSQGAKALNSALTRSLTRRSDVVAYWPCEDGRDARSVSSPIRGVSPFELSAEVEAGAGEDIPAGSLPGLLRVQPGATSVVGRVPSHPATDRYRAYILFRQDETTAGFRTALTLHTSSPAVPRWRVRTSATQTLIEARDPDGVVVLSQTQTVDPRVHGQWVLVALELRQNGTALDWLYSIVALTADLTSLNAGFGSLASTPMGRATLVGPGVGVFAEPERFFGHIALQREPGIELDAVRGYTGERAAHRLERLCSEEGLHCQVIGDPDLTMPMGPQRALPLLDLLDEIRRTDAGLLNELDMRTRTDLYNQLPGFVLDRQGLLSAAPEPTDDDQQIRNDVTAQNPFGSSARITDDQHIRDEGRYDTVIDVNTDDARLSQRAAWDVHLGTVAEMRWPSVPIALHKDPDLIPAWLATKHGDRLTIDHELTQIPGVQTDQLVVGSRQRFTRFEWDAELNCVPASPYRVWQLEHGTGMGEPEQFGRLWSPRAYLGEDIDDTATSFDVVVPVQRALNRVPDFEDPNMRIDQALVALANYSDWQYQGGMLERVDDEAFTGRWSGRFTPDGSGTAHVRSWSLRGVASGHRAYRASAWVFSPSGGFDIIPVLRWAGGPPDGFTLLGTLFGDPVTVPPGEWTLIGVEANAEDVVSFPQLLPLVEAVRVEIRYDGTPDPADVLYIDDAEVGVPGAPFTTDPANFPQPITVGGERMTVTAIGADDGTGAQTWTVTRSVNGIVKPHSAGSRVDMYPSHVIAL